MQEHEPRRVDALREEQQDQASRETEQPTETRLLRNPATGNWLPGVSGNPKGRPKKGETFLDRYRRRVEAESEALLNAHFGQLLKGDARHWIDMMNRLYGLPKQTLELQSEDDAGAQLHAAILGLLVQAGRAQGISIPIDAEYRELETGEHNESEPEN